MKLLTHTFAFFMFLLTVTSHANRQFDVEVKSNSLLSITINNVYAINQLVLQDEQGNVLFKESALAQPFKKHLSFENLPSGNYTLLLEDDYMLSNKVITKQSNGLQVKNAGVAFKPNFKFLETDSKKVAVSFTNPLKAKTQFKVYDNNGELIINLVTDEVTINKVLNFKDVPSGDYSVAINNSGRNYYRNITVD